MALAGVRPASWLALLVLWAPPARPDLIFKVPEVTVRHTAAPRAVGTGPANGTRGPPGPPPSPDPPASYIEHEVSIEQAREAARMLQLSQPTERFGCGPCGRWEREYCASSVVEDHCCCEHRYAPEPFPWLPHACYMPRARCTPRAHNCAHYTRLRDCCCTADLATKWKGLLSAARAWRLTLSGALLLLAALTLLSLCL